MGTTVCRRSGSSCTEYIEKLREGTTVEDLHGIKRPKNDYR